MRKEGRKEGRREGRKEIKKNNRKMCKNSMWKTVFIASYALLFLWG
jgi:hypothetical protein